MRQSGGYVTVSSVQSRGATFSIYLPRAGASASAEPATGVPVTEEAETAPRGRGVAVVAEDETSVRRVVKRTLVGEGFEVLKASDGVEALELVTRAHADGQLRLVVTDLAMPRMGGRELVERLRESGHRVPLLFITGYAGEDLEQLGGLGAGQDLLRKPFSPDVLAARVRQLTSTAEDRA